MYAHIIRRVREQPDTGYRKNQRADFAAARLNWFWVWMEDFLAWKIEGEKLSEGCGRWMKEGEGV